jgi:hypothetical protein
MTTPDERTRAIVQTRVFLRELITSELTPGVPDDVREEACRLLRHYPLPGDMNIAHQACAVWFGPEPKGEP